MCDVPARVPCCPVLQVTEHPQRGSGSAGMLGCTAALPTASLCLPHCKKMAKANITRDIIHRQIKVGVSPVFAGAGGERGLSAGVGKTPGGAFPWEPALLLTY